MYVTLGRHKIPVVVEQDLRDSQGNHTFELYRPGAVPGQHGDIALDYTTPKDRRRYYLIHALIHAYDIQMGEIAAGDEEGRANRMANIDDQFNHDLMMQHGEDALHTLFGDAESPLAENMPGEPIRVPAGDDGAEWPTEVRCKYCEAVHKASAVRNGDVAFDTKLDGFTMNRALWCGVCEKESVWIQRCSYDGVPWPKMIPMLARVRI